MNFTQWIRKLLGNGDGPPPAAPALALAAHKGERWTAKTNNPVAAASSRRDPPTNTAAKMPPPQDSFHGNESKQTSSLSLRDYQRIARGAQRGGITGAAQSAGEALGSAYGPLGSYAGGLIGGAVGRTLRGLERRLGGLFGHSGHGGPPHGPGNGSGSASHSQRGATPAQPVYVEDAASRALLTELLSATRGLQLRATGAGVDEAAAELSIQRLRAGAEGLHG